MGMSRPSYGRGQGSFFGRRSPPVRNPRMPMPPMNRPPTFMGRTMPQGPQMPMDGGYDGSGFMGGLMARMPTPSGPPPLITQQMPMPPMQRPGGPGKGRPRGGLMRRGRGRPMPGGPGKGRGQPQMPMPQQPFMGRVGNNMPQPPFMGRVGNNMPQEPRMTTFMPTRNMGYEGGFYGGGITDLY